jgi:ClpP class serine protease
MSAPKKSKSEQLESTEQQRAYDLFNTQDLVDLFKENNPDDLIKSEVAKHLGRLAKNSGIENQKIIYLFDDRFSISQFHSNKIYNAISENKNEKDILLVVLSDGGKIEPAYLISKACKRLKKEKFIVSIPRKAKSAATLIALGADEIHMGMLSELGPIDPQFGGFPALGLSNALSRLAELSCQYPQSSEMFAKYLTANLNLRDLGYFERINESATQYAERLLAGRELPNGHTPKSLANHLTNHYKDHSFVIDSDEAIELLGEKIVKIGTSEYQFGNDVYSFLEFCSLLSDIFRKHTIRYLGETEDGLVFDKKNDT